MSLIAIFFTTSISGKRMQKFLVVLLRYLIYNGKEKEETSIKLNEQQHNGKQIDSEANEQNTLHVKFQKF